MKTVKYIMAAIAAFILATILLPFGFIFGMIYSMVKKFGSEYIYNVLISIDQAGNANCSVLFNLIWITPKSENKFGNPEETISSVLGKNKLSDTLTWFGNFIAGLLNAVQKNHVENSIES